MILDCHTRDFALKSISQIYGVPSNVIDAFLKDIDLDVYYSKHSISNPPHKTITKLLEQKIRCEPQEIFQINWFHLTRVIPSENFARGILPLDDALECIWKMLLNVLKHSEQVNNIKILRKEDVPNFQYNLKVGQPMHGGPYGMLVREVAFQSSEMCNHDYLGLPEIIEDICQGYEKRFGYSIIDEVISVLTPCIVKFRSNKRLGHDCIEAAVYYLYLTGHNEELIDYANTCFDGQNKTIPKKDIINIEFL